MSSLKYFTAHQQTVLLILLFQVDLYTSFPSWVKSYEHWTCDKSVLALCMVEMGLRLNDSSLESSFLRQRARSQSEITFQCPIACSKM